MKVHIAIVPITIGSGIFRLFLLNFLLFNYVDKFFKFFNSFVFISLKQEIKISTVRRRELRPVVCLIRNTDEIVRCNFLAQLQGIFPGPTVCKPLSASLLGFYDFLRSQLINS